ncbi:MAG: hypothetical protein EZS28_005755 [Streblomastix strix]|uniref:Uncharacterized protein n=1 Tax=Streblomastix strix TaxID=222440 RepID=A0A5J4WUK8_9EUKA|nr:MAG: hypothetical protein EZS28_005755 [Streblomastix strix]
MLDKKLNISYQFDAYTKQEDDTLLLLKADEQELIDAYSKSEADALLDDKLNITDQIDAYSIIEDDVLLLLKADKTELIDAYTKQEDDTLLDDKLNISDQIDNHSQTEDDELLALKLNISDQIGAYSKQEDGALLLLKADKTELDNYVDLTSTQTITGQKQFGIISVSSISKQNKNEALILLAGGDIASGKSKGYVFATTDEMYTWMEDQENVVKLAIGDNLFIVDKQVMDYWWDSTSLRALETELPDMSNVMTILGAATGGGNAITDLSFDGNTLIPAKNSSFMTINYDETIIGQKTFNTTIHSVGISVQNYDNNSVVCAGGGIKAICDLNVSVEFSNYYNKSQTYSQTETDQKLNLKLNISNQIDAYSKTQDDALLLLKANKTELIDTHNKTKADALLDYKLNVSDQIDEYTKTQDDALLLLKADKTELIDAYSKTEIDTLLDDKLNISDQIDTYMKNQDDTLLLLKADKTELIDAYTKGEADNLLNNKTNSGASCIKGEDDALLLLKADKTQLIDSYSKREDDALLMLKVDKTQLIDVYIKGESDNLLNNKADSEVSNTKGQDDALLLLKANQSTTYINTETDYLISQIEAGDVDLSGYMTLGTAQTINANKTFNNAFKFLSSIDEMATITSTSFLKPGADDSVLLLGADGTKPLSEFASGSVDDSNYIKKDGDVQNIQDDDYITLGAVKSEFVSTIYRGSISDNLTATQFIKSGKDDSSVLLAGGGDRLLSSFEEIEDLTSSAFSGMKGAVIYYKLIRIGNLYIFSLLVNGGTFNAGTFNPNYFVQDDVSVMTYIPFPNYTVDKGGYVSITHSNGIINLKLTTNTYIQCASAAWFK